MTQQQEQPFLLSSVLVIGSFPLPPVDGVGTVAGVGAGAGAGVGAGAGAGVEAGAEAPFPSK